MYWGQWGIWRVGGVLLPRALGLGHHPGASEEAGQTSEGGFSGPPQGGQASSVEPSLYTLALSLSTCPLTTWDG